MKRALVVTSSYAPAMIADMHRARHLAWDLPAEGWAVEILAPDRDFQHPSCLDSDSDAFFAASTAVHWANAWRPGLFRALRLRGIGWRALVPLYRKGRDLLRTGRFDIVYISTSQAPLMLLGPAWHRRLGVPYVLDIHDPIYKERRVVPEAAHRGLKHSVSRALEKYLEAAVLRDASGIVAVSREYVDALRRRHGGRGCAWLGDGYHAVIPFPASPRDLQAGNGAGRASDGRATIAYVGAGGPVMARAFTALCRALTALREREPATYASFRFVLRGTTYGWVPGQPRLLEELAERLGVGEAFDEDPARVSYRESIACLARADGVLVLGVDDAGYMPSKLFNYALTGKPLLAVLRADGSAMELFRGSAPIGHVIAFGADDPPIAESRAVLSAFIREVVEGKRSDRSAMLAPFDVHAMARRHAEMFDRCARP